MISCEWKTDKSTCSILIERKQAAFLARCRHNVFLQSYVRAVATAVVNSSGLLWADAVAGRF
jgi:predicted RNase H-like nuclease